MTTEYDYDYYQLLNTGQSTQRKCSWPVLTNLYNWRRLFRISTGLEVEMIWLQGIKSTKVDPAANSRHQFIGDCEWDWRTDIVWYGLLQSATVHTSSWKNDSVEFLTRDAL